MNFNSSSEMNLNGLHHSCLPFCVPAVYTCIQVWDRWNHLKSPSKGSKTIWGNCFWSCTMFGETGEGEAVLKTKVQHENCLESWEVIVQEVRGAVFFWKLCSLLRWWHSRATRVSPVTICLPQLFCMLFLLCGAGLRGKGFEILLFHSLLSPHHCTSLGWNLTPPPAVAVLISVPWGFQTPSSCSESVGLATQAACTHFQVCGAVL